MHLIIRSYGSIEWCWFLHAYIEWYFFGWVWFAVAFSPHHRKNNEWWSSYAWELGHINRKIFKLIILVYSFFKAYNKKGFFSQAYFYFISWLGIIYFFFRSSSIEQFINIITFLVTVVLFTMKKEDLLL